MPGSGPGVTAECVGQPHRHCERSEAIQKPSRFERWIASSLTLLAMTVVRSRLEGIDRVSSRGGADVGFQAVAVHHVDWTIKQACDVIFKAGIVEHGEMRLRID